jgi:hypothetical protein
VSWHYQPVGDRGEGEIVLVTGQVNLLPLRLSCQGGFRGADRGQAGRQSQQELGLLVLSMGRWFFLCRELGLSQAHICT